MPNRNIIIMLIALMRSLFHEEMRVQALTADLIDDNPDNAADAARTLGELGNPVAVMPLLEMLPLTMQELNQATTPDERAALVDLRQDVVRALGRIADDRATQPLVAVMHHDGDRGIQYEAADALRHIGTPAALDAVRAWDGNNSP